MTTDLTFIILKAFSQNGKFDQGKWLNNIGSFVKQENLNYSWNEEEDQWIRISLVDKQMAIFNRNVALVFCQHKICNLCNMHLSNTESLVTFSVDDFHSKKYRIDLNLAKQVIHWHTDVIDSHQFSIDDLLYATH